MTTWMPSQIRDRITRTNGLPTNDPRRISVAISRSTTRKWTVVFWVGLSATPTYDFDIHSQRDAKRIADHALAASLTRQTPLTHSDLWNAVQAAWIEINREDEKAAGDTTALITEQEPTS
jgi:hypothetical protein